MDERQQGAHARRVMQAYEAWFKGKPELDILRLMGLFDRPAERGAMDALRAAPPIPSLTTNLQALSHADWQYAVENLRTARLLAAPDPGTPDTLDCHPLLREHFADQLRAGDASAWREAHRRLYEYYKSSAKELPDTIQEMMPLFAAVMHGCQAGKHQEAFIEVYWRRIQRGQEFFNAKKLGAFGADLAALAGFFDPPWRKPVDGLKEDWKGFVLNEVGTRLRALGRLAESTQPMQASLAAYIALQNWAFAARIASNLSELHLTIGDVRQALTYARQSVELADRSGDAFERMSDRTTSADALHQAGQLAEAEIAFREAEVMQKARQPEFPLLYSLQGFQYCALLLSQGQYAEVQRRASQTLEWAKQGGGSLLSIALEILSLGRAYLMQARDALTPHPPLPISGEGEQGRGAISQAAAYLDRAVDGLRQAGRQDHLPRALLARAGLWRVTGEWEKAQRDLDEAFAIASRGGMKLFEADCYLEYARLYLVETFRGNVSTAREHLDTAKRIIDETGYHRRDKEVKELEAQMSF